MNKAEIVKFINGHPLCHLATVEGNSPRVRGMMMYRADEKGILFHTSDTKDLWHQVKANPNVEICFNDLANNLQIRVEGRAQIVEDPDLKKEIVEERTFLKPFVEKNGYEPMKVFRVTGCRAQVWTMSTNFAPKEYIDL
jgi:pyridoxamine 5'-phosphate oxidase